MTPKWAHTERHFCPKKENDLYEKACDDVGAKRLFESSHRCLCPTVGLAGSGRITGGGFPLHECGQGAKGARVDRHATGSSRLMGERRCREPPLARFSVAAAWHAPPPLPRPTKSGTRTHLHSFYLGLGGFLPPSHTLGGSGSFSPR